ncbi:MAG: glycosyltransferase family 39 protein [Candidatus Pacearchaeota archaeon]
MKEEIKEEKEDKAENKEKKLKKEKIKVWLKDPYNLAFLIILLFAFSLRLYYFFLTRNQPLWWDEAEYMLKAKNIAFNTPDTGWWYGRPILFPLISAFFFKLGFNEVGIRFLFVLISTLNVFFIYTIGKILFNKRVGLISSLLISFSYIDLFYTNRLLVNLPEIFFSLFVYFLFLETEFYNKSKKLIYFIFPLIIIGTLIRFTIGLIVIILFFYFIFTNHFKFFKIREWYISIFLGILLFLPYAIYSYIKYNNPFYVIISVLIGSTKDRAIGDTPIKVFIDYIKYLPNYTNILLFIFFLIGFFLLLLEIILGFDKIKESKKLKKYLWLFLAFIIPLIYFGFFVNHFEDRYLAIALPCIFILTSKGIENTYSFIKKYLGKFFSILIILAILLFGIYQMYNHSNEIIRIKLNSYQDLKFAGLWIKENSNPDDIIISTAIPQITYYSERATYNFPENESKFLSFLEEKKPKYMILSIWEKSPPWAYVWPENNSDKVRIIQVYFLDKEKKQVSTIIYEIIY